jgi:hypothetical protein
MLTVFVAASAGMAMAAATTTQAAMRASFFTGCGPLRRERESRLEHVYDGFGAADQKTGVSV